jgi:hypothetical protein
MYGQLVSGGLFDYNHTELPLIINHLISLDFKNLADLLIKLHPTLTPSLSHSLFSTLISQCLPVSLLPTLLTLASFTDISKLFRYN